MEEAVVVEDLEAVEVDLVEPEDQENRIYTLRYILNNNNKSCCSVTQQFSE
jgi:hypothetical protein